MTTRHTKSLRWSPSRWIFNCVYSLPSVLMIWLSVAVGSAKLVNVPTIDLEGGLHLARIVALFVLAAHASAQTALFEEYLIPTTSSGVIDITQGPDNAMWFVEETAGKIGRITRAGVVTEFTLPVRFDSVSPRSITAGPDDALWFTETNGQKIGRITTAGEVTEFSVPPSLSNPQGIVAGPDGALWFTSLAYPRIGRISTAGTITEFQIPGADPTVYAVKCSGITVGPDGALWFTESGANKIGRITTSGVVAEFPLPFMGRPDKIIVGSDGALWWADSGFHRIGKITVAGVVSEYPFPTVAPFGLVRGPDNAIWFTQLLSGNIGRIASEASGNHISIFSVPGGYPFPTSSATPFGIASHSDGSIWFVERNTNKIKRIGLAITTSSAADGTVGPGAIGRQYSFTLGAALGRPPYRWALVGGELPAGVSGPNASTGELTGVPTKSGDYFFTVSVTDSSAPAQEVRQELMVYIPAQPILTASPTSLSFTHQIGASFPGSRSISVDVQGEPSTLNTVASVTTLSGGTWLSVSPTTAATTPGNVSISVNPAGLSAGTYTGFVSITAAGASNSPLQIPVTLNVAAQPALMASATAVAFAHQIGASTPASQNLSIGSTGAALSFASAVSVTTPSGGTWLSVSPTTVATTPGNISISVNPAGLSVGTYTGFVSITAPGASNSPFQIPITLNVATQPALTASTTAVTFAHQIGAATPASQNISIGSTGAPLPFGSAVSVTTPAGGTWLSVSPTTTATTPGNVSISVNPAGLSAGTYTGFVSITAAGASNSPLQIPVTLNVAAQPVLTASTAALSFTHQIGAATPASQSISMGSTGAVLSFSSAISVATPSGGSWLSVSPTTVATTPANVSISVNPAGLSAGTYTGFVSIAAAGAFNSPLQIPVTLNIAAAFSWSPTSLSFVSRGYALPSPQAITLNSPARAMSEVNSGVPWLQLAFQPPATNVGTRITVGVDPAQLSRLPIGNHTGVVRFLTPDNSSELGRMPVTLTILPLEEPEVPPIRFPSPGAVCPTTTLMVSQQYSGALSATGGGAFISWKVGGNFPPGLVLSGNTIVGAPNTAGTYTYTVDASSGSQSASMTCTVIVAAGPLKILSSCPTSAAPQGSFYVLPIVPSGGMGGTSYQYTATGLPDGLTVANGQIRGNPSAEPGTYNTQIKVTSGNQTVTLSCPITIAPPVDAPPKKDPLSLNGQCPTMSFTSGDTVTLSISAAGGGGSYQFTKTAGPAWLTLGVSGNGATLTGVAPTPGDYPVTVTVSDGGGSATFNCTIRVNAPPLRLVSPPCPTTTLTLGDTFELPFSATGGSGTLNWKLSGPSWLNLSATTGSAVTLSGKINDVGEFPIVVSISDSTGSPQEFRCTVRAVAQPIVVTALSCPTSVSRGTGLSLNFSATGGVPPLKWALDGPSWLSLNTSQGTAVRLTGTPPAQGPYSFSLTTSDDRGTTPSTYTCQFSVPAITPPSVQISGLTASVTQPTESGDLILQLSAPAPVALTARLTLSFAPNVDLPNFPTNPWVQFGPLTPAGASGPTTVRPLEIVTTIPAGAQTVPLNARVSLSNVAGMVNVQLASLMDGQTNLLTGTQQPVQILIPKQQPVLRKDSVQFTRSELRFQVYSSTLDIQRIVLTFKQKPDVELAETTASFDSQIQSQIQQFYRNSLQNAAATGVPDLTLRFPISIEGEVDGIESVTIAVTNSVGTSTEGPFQLR